MADKPEGCASCGEKTSEASDVGELSDIMKSLPPLPPSAQGLDGPIMPFGLRPPGSATMSLSGFGAESENVIDQRGLWTPTEDRLMFNNETGEIMLDPTINKGWMGWRDDPVTG